MRLFLDDERATPEGWVRASWPSEAIALLESGQVEELSLDHDLGDDERGTGYDVVLWIEEAVILRGFKPPKMAVHSANSSARDKMLAGIRSIEQHAAAGRAGLRIGFIEEDQHGSAIDLLHDLGIHYNGAKAASRAEVQANFLENLVSPRSPVRLVVASANGGTVIGLVAISSFQSFVNPSPAEREQLFVKEVYVLSSQRRRGVGEALINWVLQYAANRGCVRVDWTVNASNEGARRFYEKLGAIHVADRLTYRISGEALSRNRGSLG
jgi:ribosomal protein S18 acetylase RimI-like enzyme